MSEKSRVYNDVLRVAAALGLRPGDRMPSQGKLAAAIGTGQPQVSQVMISMTKPEVAILVRTAKGFVLDEGVMLPSEPPIDSLDEFRPTARGRAAAPGAAIVAGRGPRLAFQPFGGEDARLWVSRHPGGNEVSGEATDELDVLARFGIPGGSRHVWNERARAAFLGCNDGGDAPDRVAIATFGGRCLGSAARILGAETPAHRTPEAVASVAAGGEASMRVVRLRFAHGLREVAKEAGWAAHLVSGMGDAVVADCEVVVNKDTVAVARVLWRVGVEHVCGAEIAAVPKEL